MAGNSLMIVYPIDRLRSPEPAFVQAAFVTDSSGHGDAGSIRILYSTGPAFTDAVIGALQGWYDPGVAKDGRRVATYTVQPFSFAVPHYRRPDWDFEYVAPAARP